MLREVPSLGVKARWILVLGLVTGCTYSWPPKEGAGGGGGASTSTSSGVGGAGAGGGSTGTGGTGAGGGSATDFACGPKEWCSAIAQYCKHTAAHLATEPPTPETWECIELTTDCEAAPGNKCEVCVEPYVSNCVGLSCEEEDSPAAGVIVSCD